jgi:hypothetical protein
MSCTTQQAGRQAGACKAVAFDDTSTEGTASVFGLDMSERFVCCTGIHPSTHPSNTSFDISSRSIACQNQFTATVSSRKV